MNRTIISSLSSTFIAIAEHRSITAAAAELNLARSAVSQSLMRLEDQLGVKLAVRTTRKLHLTPAGERYYHRCKQIVGLADVAAAEMEAFGAAPSGPITVTAPHAMISTIVAPLISDLTRKFPDLSPRVLADDRRLDLISEGVDLAISIGTLEDSTLKARKVGVMEDILCVLPGLSGQLGRADGLDITEIEALPYIAHTRQSFAELTFEMRDNADQSTNTITLTPKLSANTVEAVFSLVQQGAGVGLLPDFLVAKELDEGRLVRLLPGRTLGKKDVHAVHAYDSYAPRSVQVFIDGLKDKMKQPG